MQKERRLAPAEQPRELQLTAGGREEIVAANDVRHALDVVVDRHGELIRPVAVAIADQEIAALLGRALFLRSVPEVDEALDGRLEAHPQPDTGRVGEPPIAAGTWIPKLVLGSPSALQALRLTSVYAPQTPLEVRLTRVALVAQAFRPARAISARVQSHS